MSFTLFIWSLIVFSEILLIAWLTKIPWIAAGCLILYSPVRAAFSGPSAFVIAVPATTAAPSSEKGQPTAVAVQPATASAAEKSLPPMTAQPEVVSQATPAAQKPASPVPSETPREGCVMVLFFRGTGVRIPLRVGQSVSDQPREGSSTRLLAEVTQKPNDPSVIGLKNLTSREWVAKVGSSETRVSPQKSVAITTGMAIDFGGFIADVFPASATGE